MQFAIYPLETIRTRLAVCPTGTYSGLRHAALTIWHTEGAFGFYRGLVPSLVRQHTRCVRVRLRLHVREREHVRVRVRVCTCA